MSNKAQQILDSMPQATKDLLASRTMTALDSHLKRVEELAAEKFKDKTHLDQIRLQGARIAIAELRKFYQRVAQDLYSKHFTEAGESLHSN